MRKWVGAREGGGGGQPGDAASGEHQFRIECRVDQMQRRNMDAFRGKIYIWIRKPGLSEIRERVWSGTADWQQGDTPLVCEGDATLGMTMFCGNGLRGRMSEVMNESD